ncbi:MAG TPA: hypothetical protein V6D48_08590, partial [Oculatellaceae cyanobacterium]
MFTQVLNKAELRQGDIIEGLYYPLINCGTLRILGEATNQPLSQNEDLSLTAISEKKEGVTFLTAQVKVLRSFVVVLSQCCDLALRNDKLEAPAFVIAPLFEVPYQIKTKSERLSKLQENSLENFVNLFYIPQNEPLPQDYVVDFGRLTSLPRAEFNFTLSKKVLQMTDEARVLFKLKLASHFGRPTQE